jgi:hypothetical protein
VKSQKTFKILIFSTGYPGTIHQFGPSVHR